MRPAGALKPWIGVGLSTLAVLVATLHVSGSSTPDGWTWSLTTGETALAGLIQNLLLFIPLGACLTVAGVRTARAIGAGAALSFTVEFLQQWIPGRDPSVGDIVCNTLSTALGVLLVATAHRWLLPSPRRSAWQALATAALAVLIWLGTGAALRPDFPPPPHHTVARPDFKFWGLYHGDVLGVNYRGGVLSARAVYPHEPPHRDSPLAAVIGANDARAVILFVDGNDLSVSYHMPAVRLTLEQPDLRWRDALANVAPGDTFTAATGHDGERLCLLFNDQNRCGLGYTVGDGWKLIYYPSRFPSWALVVINALWVAGCVIGVGYWAARTAAAGGGEGRMARIAVGIVLIGLVIVPMVTGLKGTSLWEWIGALLGIEAGLILGARNNPVHPAGQ